MIGKTNAGASKTGAIKNSVITVTYPEGSDCSVSNGIRTFRAPDTSGTAAFAVPIGTWTVKSVYGSDSDEDHVEITENGQIVSVELSYRVYLFKDGAFKEGLNVDLYKNASIDSNGYLKLWSSTVLDSNDYAIMFERNTFDFSPYTELHWEVQTAETFVHYPGTSLGLLPNGWSVTGSYLNWGAAALSTNNSTEWTEETLDISSVNQACYLQIGGYTRGYVKSIWVK